MSFQLTFGGGETVLVRNTGTVNPVQGFVVSQETVVIKNITALPSNFLFQLISYIQAPLSVNAKFWIKISGIWKQATPFIKIGGTWKQATPFIKVGGTWK